MKLTAAGKCVDLCPKEVFGVQLLNKSSENIPYDIVVIIGTLLRKRDVWSSKSLFLCILIILWPINLAWEFENASAEWLRWGMLHDISFPPWTPYWFLVESMNSYSIVPLEYQPWVYSIVAAFLVGIAGIIPLVFIPADYEDKRKRDVSHFNLLQLMLSFAVGGLLADVFLHLLPEAWTSAINGGSSPHEAFTDVGLCVLVGIFVFIVVEMMASDADLAMTTINDNANGNVGKSYSGSKKRRKEETKPNKTKVIGYLNLVANGIDNFAHGLAVAGSFLVSYKTGVLTTTAILIHEIPHEIGDFAILLKSGFNKWEAARAQIYTSSLGLVGALVTLFLGTSEFMGGIQVYILGFTAGGFLNIALVTLLPDLLQEERPIHSAAQLFSLLFGTATMASVALLC